MFIILGRDAKLSGSYCLDGTTTCLGGAQAMTGSIELNGPSGALQAAALGDTNTDGQDDFVVSAPSQGTKGTFTLFKDSPRGYHPARQRPLI